MILSEESPLLCFFDTEVGMDSSPGSACACSFWCYAAGHQSEVVNLS